MDELEIREVLFGEQKLGNSYAVLCHSDETSIPISSVFSEASMESTPAEFRLLDCNYVLPASGKTIAQRFNLNLKKRPTIFISGAVGPPQQVKETHLKTGLMLAKFLREKLEVGASRLETTQDLRSKCLDKDVCALLLKGQKDSPSYLKDAMKKLVAEFPNVSFAAVDANVLYVLNLEEHLPELSGGQPRFAVFKKLAGGVDSKSDRLKTSVAMLPTNGVGYGPMSNLLASVVNGSADMKKLTSLPVIQTRTKKLEEKERAKRNRQYQRSAGSGDQRSTTSGGAFHENDGSWDGRKAERDRRRAEHRANNNVREKTPEEIAEIERRRRLRMEEQAAKWNVAPEDLPPEGDYTFEDDFNDYDVEADDMDDGNEGDDVMDLD
jgi:hypothetical protein